MPIELNLTPQERRAQIIRNCGSKWIGERPIGNDVLVYFIDPITTTTLTLPPEDVTELKVMAKLESAWREHGLTLVPGLVENMRDLVTPIETALKFITAGRNLPFEVISAAAHAAIRELLLFEAFPDDTDDVLRRKHFPEVILNANRIRKDMPPFLRKVMEYDQR